MTQITLSLTRLHDSRAAGVDGKAVTLLGGAVAVDDDARYIGKY